MKSAAAAVEATREPIMAKAIQELNIFSFYVLEIK